ncbi:MAG: hypothetical protein J6T80_08480 [Paludibacteraceae bacterium]|nr:hypothetical protein [Paludibacteraceae bacterium]
MKRTLFMVAVTLMSVAMWAGENDLLWDFTETPPNSAPVPAQNNASVNLLFNNSGVNDGMSDKNNRLNGIKLNDAGYCTFTKSAVEGKLRLGFGPRSGSNKANLDVYTWTGDATPLPAKSAMTLVGTTKELDEYGFVTIELSATQNNIYICRHNGVETILQYIQFKEKVPRSFTDFKIEFRDNPYSVLLPSGGALPTGVSVSGTTYNGEQHGIYGGTITVPVDGPIKFTIGACQYSTGLITIKKDGTTLASISNAAPCGEVKPNYNQFVTYTYTEGAATLTFEIANNVYIPYFFAEATDITPCTITFKDQNGGVLGSVQSYEGAVLETIPYSESDLPAIASGYKFRGWFYTNGARAYTDDIIQGNTTIQAKVTEIENVTVGSVWTYDFTSSIFYPWDHESIVVKGGYFHDGTHGWAWKNGESFRVAVAGKAVITLAACQYSKEGAVWNVKDTKGTSIGSLAAVDAADGKEFSLRYTGEADTLTFTLSSSGECYLHKVVVYNVLDFVEKNATSGYYEVPANDVAAFLLALVQANSEGNAKIFLPNGTYDLGETVLTTISGNNISIIGQSRDGVIIKNAPDYKTESIDKTATLRIAKNVSGTYLQDLTIQNALDYYKNDNGRAVALWDQGTKTVCKNVRLLSYQDTYYSNLQGAVKYFEDCEIHGTVDFICGDGSVYFKNNLLYAEKRGKNGGGNDALTANNGPASDHGYVFESCVLKSECPVISFGRAWNNKPTTTFLNTLVDYSAGQFTFSDDSKVQRWTKELMNANAWPAFGEFNTHTADGTVLTPASNVVTFVDSKSGNATQQIETVLNAEQAAKFTMAYTLGDWAETAANDAKQVELIVKEDGSWEATTATLFLVEKDGKCSFVKELPAWEEGLIVRAANARGGFGKPAHKAGEEAINDPFVNSGKATKIMRDGQVLIIRDGKAFNALGVEVR